jgi:hypothetical protein
MWKEIKGEKRAKLFTDSIANGAKPVVVVGLLYRIEK